MGLLDNIGAFLSDEENQLNLASGFNNMSGNPNAGNIQAGINQRLKGIGDDRKLKAVTKFESDKLLRQSGMAVKMLGDKFPMLTQALQAGIITPNEAITAARKGSDVKVVGKSLVDSTGKVLFTSTDASGGDTTAFQTLKARAREAGLKDGTPAYQQFMLTAGKASGIALTIGADGSIQMTQGGAAKIKPLTANEGKATGFYNRANASDAIITELEQTGTELGQFILGQIPMTNFARSPEYQRLDQAKRDWISAVLRLESGAAIGESEFENYDLAYFPQVGDSPEVLEQKRRGRKLHADSLKFQSGAGVSATPSTTTTLTYDPNTGELK